ncbi:hypothetical protein [Breoghania sp. JC706]|uniref:hypothetical protein n=1 Tax=Breoghania sp. JC706 TaxID=3117732 RepID=UPI003009E6C1
MLGNRRLGNIQHIIDKFQLDPSKPAPDSLFFKMWDAAKPIAEATYELPFLQGILKGTLDPNSYGAYNVADAYYCDNGAEDYGTAAGRADGFPVLREFLLYKKQRYEKYNDSFSQTWHLKGTDGIAPPKAVSIYVRYEEIVTSLLTPAYCLVAMLPCEYLWYWLAHEMGTPKSGNLYASWITGNDYPDGAYAMGNVLDTYQKEYPHLVETDQAVWLYQFATYCEYADFASGTGAITRLPSSLGLKAPNTAWANGWSELNRLYEEFENLAI